jgi:hypothetical protein
MKTYRILVHDRRCAAPIELVAEMARDERAAEFARERWAASAHVTAIEVWSGPRRLCSFADAQRRAA